jgi:hypothetical protein
MTTRAERRARYREARRLTPLAETPLDPRYRVLKREGRDMRGHTLVIEFFCAAGHLPKFTINGDPASNFEVGIAMWKIFGPLNQTDRT